MCLRLLLLPIYLLSCQERQKNVEINRTFLPDFSSTFVFLKSDIPEINETSSIDRKSGFARFS